MPPRHDRIPVTVIGGFLGSGKTTLLNHLIRTADRTFGVIVNEFGDQGIDGALIQNLDDNVTELTGGCLCCTARNDLVAALVRLATHTRPPDHVLVELSGLADPAPVLQTLLTPDVSAVFELDGLITVVDARNLHHTLQHHPEAALQLAYANVTVINKADLAGPDLVRQTCRTALQLAPLARTVTGTHSRVHAGHLLNLRAFCGPWRPHGHTHAHTPGLTSFTLRTHRPLNTPVWERFLHTYVLSRPGDVLRVKGFLALHGIPERVTFQAVRDVFTADVMPGTRHDGTSHLVLIGRDLNAQEYREAFHALHRWPTGATTPHGRA